MSIIKFSYLSDCVTVCVLLLYYYKLYTAILGESKGNVQWSIAHINIYSSEKNFSEKNHHHHPHSARITSQSLFRRGCRDSDTFIAFNIGCAFPKFFLIGWSYFWLVEVTFDWLKIFCVILPIVRSNVLRIYFTLAVAAIDHVESAMVAAIV